MKCMFIYGCVRAYICGRLWHIKVVLSCYVHLCNSVVH